MFSFALLLAGHQFVHDDLAMLLFNPHFSELLTWRDTFTFPFQSTKPITSWIFAASNFIFDFSVFGQRITSLIFHALNVCLWNLLLTRRFGCSWLKLVATIAFAIAPLHSETLGVAQFRGEILATTFTLLAWLLAKPALAENSPVKMGLLFGMLVAASLSKEIFFPLVVLLIYSEWKGVECSPAQKFRAHYLLGSVSIITATLLYAMFLKDSEGPYSYQGQIGPFVLPFHDYVKLASRSLIEGMGKIITGAGLSSIRLSARNGWGSSLPLIAHLAILLFAALCALRALRKANDRAMLLAFLLPASFYLLIPNRNAGSEHYWYFPLAPALWLGYQWLSRKISGKRLLGFVLAAHLLLCFIGLQNRLFDYDSRTAFYSAELAHHPESPWAWANMALTEAENQKPWSEITKIFDQAAARGGGIDVEVQKLHAAISVGRLDVADDLLTFFFQKQFSGRGTAVAFLRASFAFYRAGKSTKALAAARTALSMYPKSQFSQKMVERLEKEVYLKPPMQELFAINNPSKNEKDKEDGT